MNAEEPPTEFERRVQQALRASSDSLDGALRSKLTQARHAALDGASRRARPWLLRGWHALVPAGAAAAVLLAVLYVRQPGPVSPGSDLEMLADADVYAMNSDAEQEPDYEFYEWAAAGGDAGAGSGT